MVKQSRELTSGVRKIGLTLDDELRKRFYCVSFHALDFCVAI